MQCADTSRKAKRSYYENFDLEGIANKNKLWASVKPLFSSKVKSTECMILEENGKIIGCDKGKAKIFKEFCVNMVPNLGTNTNQDFLINAEYLDDPNDKAETKYNDHPSILKIEKFILNLCVCSLYALLGGQGADFTFITCSKGKYY